MLKQRKFPHYNSQHSSLHQLLPTLSIKENVTQLDIILEAIRYIDSLTHKLEICENHDTMDQQEEEEESGRMTECWWSLLCDNVWR